MCEALSQRRGERPYAYLKHPEASSYSIFLSPVYQLPHCSVGFPCSSVGKASVYNAGDLGLIPGSVWSPKPQVESQHPPASFLPETGPWAELRASKATESRPSSMLEEALEFSALCWEEWGSFLYKGAQNNGIFEFNTGLTSSLDRYSYSWGLIPVGWNGDNVIVCHF